MLQSKTQGATSFEYVCEEAWMPALDDHSIAYAEHVPGGLLIVFVDGEFAVFPTEFLRAASKDLKFCKDVGLDVNSANLLSGSNS